ncbi:hypothetical protein PR003_g15191 [Phytophthora rubi]|uniref:Uncharacterized protein n=1 Tax=Phytophthora rubi TaxID=129364 RepID=A0A6A4EX02_9STRA|nr:hypothetical protein PR003_g15191 [Phytophthora rubi]
MTPVPTITRKHADGVGSRGVHGLHSPGDEQSQSDLKLLQVAQLGKLKKRAHEGAALSDDSAEI